MIVFVLEKNLVWIEVFNVSNNIVMLSVFIGVEL